MILVINDRCLVLYWWDKWSIRRWMRKQEMTWRKRGREANERERASEREKEKEKDEWLYERCAPFSTMINNQSAKCFIDHFDPRRSAKSERTRRRRQSTSDCYSFGTRREDNWIFAKNNLFKLNKKRVPLLMKRSINLDWVLSSMSRISKFDYLFLCIDQQRTSTKY